MKIMISTKLVHIHVLMKFMVGFCSIHMVGAGGVDPGWDNKVHCMSLCGDVHKTVEKTHRIVCSLLQVFMACPGVQSKEKYFLHGKL